MAVCSIDVNVNVKSMPSDDVMARVLKLESSMASALDVVNGLVPHIDALEQRDAVHTQAITDLTAKVADLQAQVAKLADAPPELVDAVDAIAARLDKVDQDAPPVPGVVTTEPSTG